MEEWIRWEPICDLMGKFYVDALILSEEGLIIKLSSDKERKKVKIVFEFDVDAYRYTNESFYLELFSDLTKQHGPGFYKNWTFFKIMNSQYVGWMSQKSSGWADMFSFTHFCIVGGDEVVDIIARYEPKVKIIKL